MFDLLVIGAGPGGYTAAARAAKLGLSTAIVEERSWGGTCLNRGCVPTKTLLHASEVYRSAADGAAIGIHAEGLRADIPEIFTYKERISRQLCGGVESLLKGAGVTLLRGRAVITAPGSVRVTGEDGGDYEARRILIATGSVPVRPPIPGLELAMTSDELLEGTDHLYRSIVIIGGGVIGVEFATFYSDLGCSVTLLEGMDRLLPNMDRELGQNLALILKKQGVQVCPLHGGSSGADAGGHCRPLHRQGDPRLRRGGGGAVRHRPQSLPGWTVCRGAGAGDQWSRSVGG